MGNREIGRTGRGALVAILVVAFAVGFAQTSSAAQVRLTFSNAPANGTTFGSRVLLDAKIDGLDPAKLDRAQLTFYQAEFPYVNFRPIASVTPKSSSLVSRQMKPRINSRYKVKLTVDGKAKARGISPVLYVNPVRRGGNYSNLPSGSKYGPSFETYSRALLSKWRKVPRRLRTVYYYIKCPSQRGWRLLGAKRATTHVHAKAMTLMFPGFRVRARDCRAQRYWTVQSGLSKLPGYLGNGDDGAGAPNSTVRLYKTWVRVAGRARISDRVARKLRW